MITYRIGTSGHALIFAAEVLDRFERYKQRRLWAREAGGQLFARVDGGAINIVEATGPRPTDRRSRYNYVPDRRAEQREIDERFLLGLHFVGDWHTHPQDIPRPSGVDLVSTADGVRKSRHSLNAFVMAIVGREAFPTGLYVAVHDGDEEHVLAPEFDGIEL